MRWRTLGALLLLGIPIDTRVPASVAGHLLAAGRATNRTVAAYLESTRFGGTQGGDALDDGSIVPDEDMGPDEDDGPAHYGPPMSPAQFASTYLEP